MLAGLLLDTVRAKQAAQRQLNTLFQQHTDQPIFASLHGARDFLAPTLLARLGDDRQHFPTGACIQALAGACPVTEISEKRKVIRFCRTCDRQFRHIAQQWARCSVSRSVWAAAYLDQARERGHSDNHGYRCLANRWLAIAWKLWQTRQPYYDEAYHLRQRALRSKPQN